jgi:hypothetical protein
MVPEIKAKWVEALRSGEYEQGCGALRTEDGKYCCLGVLTDLYCKAKGVTFDGVTRSNRWVLNLSVRRWAGLESPNPAVPQAPLAWLNDSGRTFAEIADLIEGNDPQ